MEIVYQNEASGLLKQIRAGGVTVPFGDQLGPAFYYKTDRKQIPVPLHAQGTGYTGMVDGVIFGLSYRDQGDYLSIEATLENTNAEAFAPEAVGLKLGVDTYMVEYPQWNDVFFPTFMRCEKTHFWGYFMSPLQRVLSVTCDTPVAAWELDYNQFGDEDTADFGHRIYTANLLLLCQGPLPTRHPQHLDCLLPGQKMSWVINLMPLGALSEFGATVANRFGLPVIDLERYTLALGEEAQISVQCKEGYQLSTLSPSGKVYAGDLIPCKEYGVYTVTLSTDSGRTAEAKFYVRREYGWYLRAARENAVRKPQKATVCTESWYGHFSSFLARKHFPDPVLDQAAQANFDEIMPLMFDFEKGKPILMPQRIQNTAIAISMLTDAYEASPETGRIYLDRANLLAEELISRQTPDGAYRKNAEHYTAVIYIAKSMLELALCEKTLSDDLVMQQRYDRHYQSAKRAVDDLCRLRETIGTEGEHTLEDGMISCSALQLGFFALTLPEQERAPYIEAAEHMISIHRCLEQMVVPDCRMRGATLRFWEAQYDVMIRGNMLNSPHGWSSWKNYATYYLYLLTGKEDYLRQTMDTIGTCIQTIDETGDLRWAFIVDPYLNVKVMVPALDAPSKDGYESAAVLRTKAYRSKYERRVMGEQYADMVSEWYRACPEGRAMGAYPSCPLIFENDSVWVDNQGGCCDNDVHEHFKCLEETVLFKAFVLVRSDGSLLTYNGKAQLEGDVLNVTSSEPLYYIHINTPRALTISYHGETYNVGKGMTMLEVK